MVFWSCYIEIPNNTIKVHLSSSYPVTRYFKFPLLLKIMPLRINILAQCMISWACIFFTKVVASVEWDQCVM